MPSDLLVNLAEEVAKEFKERPGISYTPAISDNKNKINAAGKFVQRINYMRKIFVDSGLLVYLEKSTALNSAKNSTGKVKIY